jgi:hypothetical protein
MSKYEALVNLSVPRKNDPNKETDLVMAGDTVDLDDDTAAKLLPPMRRPALVRKAADRTSERTVLLPRHLSGVAINHRTGKRVGYPGPPADARPDPPGSSQVLVQELPEGNEPVPESENQPPGDAVDLPPRHRQGATARSGR